AAGFAHKPENSVDRAPPWEVDTPDEWRKAYFKSGESSHPRAQVHVRQAGRRNQRYALLFRDYLRANPDVRDAYGRFKLQAAELVGVMSHPSGTGPYLDLKDPFFDVVMLAAEQWARDTGWTEPAGRH
ncbi:MAG: GrpB family protein, partial [Burkholderiaceae bacterium]